MVCIICTLSLTLSLTDYHVTTILLSVCLSGGLERYKIHGYSRKPTGKSDLFSCWSNKDQQQQRIKCKAQQKCSAKLCPNPS